MKLPHPQYPPKGEQYKCEECGLESISFWRELLLRITGKIKTHRFTTWHHLYDVGCIYHPKYSKKPYYYQEADRFNRKPYPYAPGCAYFWLCEECFEIVKKEEEELFNKDERKEEQRRKKGHEKSRKKT